MIFKVISRKYIYILFSVLLFNCKKEPSSFEWKTLEVTSTAYNSLAYQTDDDPFIAAFGDSLKPGLRYIAVSRDLFKLGLKHNTLVKVEGLDGTYLVKDKMHSRWRNKIDIYMGIDVKAAKNWGRRKVNISYRIEKQIESLQE